MRDIKFRVWDNLKRCWVSNKYIWRIKTDDQGVGELFPPSFFWGQHPDGLNYSQFIGIQDSNNRDIYEGDILQFHKGQAYQSEYEVYWGHCGFSLISAKRKGDKYGTFTKNLENLCPADKPVIIGNIFENPELVV